jgi:hypothetical protein
MTIPHTSSPQYYRTATRRPPHHEFVRERCIGDACCRACRAVHHNKRWALDDDLRLALLVKPSTSLVLCPGCEAVQRDHVDGVLVLESPHLSQLKDALAHLIRHEVRLEQQKNPTSRVVDTLEDSQRIELQTSTRFLALRVAQAVEKAMGGRLVIQRLRRRSFVRIYWKKT